MYGLDLSLHVTYAYCAQLHCIRAVDNVSKCAYVTKQDHSDTVTAVLQGRVVSMNRYWILSQQLRREVQQHQLQSITQGGILRRNAEMLS
jgi:hypothetical protein